ESAPAEPFKAPAAEASDDDLDPEFAPAVVPYVAPGETKIPHAVAALHAAGFLDADSLAVVLSVRHDYGDEVVTQIPPGVLEPKAAFDPSVCSLFNVIRPQDWPPLWFFFSFEEKVPADTAVMDATVAWLWDAGRRGGKLPMWEVTAFWFAAQAVRLNARLDS